MVTMRRGRLPIPAHRHLIVGDQRDTEAGQADGLVDGAHATVGHTNLQDAGVATRGQAEVTRSGAGDTGHLGLTRQRACVDLEWGRCWSDGSAKRRHLGHERQPVHGRISRLCPNRSTARSSAGAISQLIGPDNCVGSAIGNIGGYSGAAAKIV